MALSDSPGQGLTLPHRRHSEKVYPELALEDIFLSLAPALCPEVPMT